MHLAPKIQQAPCSGCLRETAHEILHQVEQDDEDQRDQYALIQCRGCGTPSLREVTFYVTDEEWGQPRYYPSPLGRKPPFWVIMLQLGIVAGKETHHIGELLGEVYEAMRGGQRRLAAMGIRAVLENVMIAKVGDHQSFSKNLDAFQKAGYISLVGRDAMRSVLDVGDAAIHRLHSPSEEDLAIAIDVLEGILAPIYSHADAAEKLSERTPKRPSRKPRTATDL